MMQDVEESKEVDFYNRQKSQSAPKIRPTRSNATCQWAARTVQHRWRQHMWTRMLKATRETLVERKLLYQERKPTGLERTMSMRMAATLEQPRAEKLALVYQVLEETVAREEEQRDEDFLLSRQMSRMRLKPRRQQAEVEHAARCIQYAFRLQRLVHRRESSTRPRFVPKRRPVTRLPTAAPAPSVNSSDSEGIFERARAAGRVLLERVRLAEDLFYEVAVTKAEDDCEVMVDEGDTLFNVCMRLLKQHGPTTGPQPDEDEVRAMLSRRSGAGTGKSLSFEEFVQIYNRLVLPS